MRVSNFLKNQLIDFADVYRKLLLKTVWITTVLSIATLMSIALLEKFSINGSNTIGLLNFLFTRHRYDTYNLVDLSKSIFILFVSIFSICLIRYDDAMTNDKEYKLIKFLSKFQLWDFICLIGVLILCLIIDYLLFQLDPFIISSVGNDSFGNWISNINLYVLRDFISLFLFSITIHNLTSDDKIKIKSRQIFYLFLAVWFMNTFASACYIYINAFVFQLILVPFRQADKYIYESFLGIILIAFNFLGYYSAMTRPFLLNVDEEK